MNKAVVASLLMVASFAPQAVKSAFGQDAPAATAAGQVQMSAPEYASYNNAMTQTTPQTKAPALEAYLTAYPQSAVKKDVLLQLMLAYSAFDPAKTVDAADRLLQVDPGNIRALTFEVYFRKSGADSLSDPSAKQAALDAAGGFAQKGLDATKPAEMKQEDFDKVKAAATPIFYSALGTAALTKKDYPGAIASFKSELNAVPVADTAKPGPILQDTFYLGQAYELSTPPDLLNCAFYVARFVAYAPEPYKTQMLPTAQYCYKKFHGAADGYDQLSAAAQANLTPPASLVVKPAPTPADIVAQIISTTPDLATLAPGDKEFILANGKPEDAAKVWDTLKGKSLQFPDTVVIESSPTALKVAISDDAVQSKTADYVFNLTPIEIPEVKTKGTPAQIAASKKEAAAAQKKQDDITAATAVGQKVTLTGTYDSYTPSPVVITMTNGEVVLPKKTPAKAPVHHAAAH
jgi:hypothetical protein